MYHNHCIKHSHPQPTKYTKMISFTNLSLILVNYSLLSNELANNIAICFIYYVLKFDICRSSISLQIDCTTKSFMGCVSVSYPWVATTCGDGQTLVHAWLNKPDQEHFNHHFYSWVGENAIDFLGNYNLYLLILEIYLI